MSHKFDKAFTDGTVLNKRGNRVETLRLAKVGTLDLSSDKIVVCDPLVPSDYQTIAKKIAPGAYPVYVALICKGGESDGTVACAKLQFSDEPIAKWEKAAKHPFNVDAGFACFADAANAAKLFADEKIKDRMETGDEFGKGSSFALKNSSGKTELVAFSSGLGDGAYQVWWGLGKNGEASALVIDFDLLHQDIWEEWHFPTVPNDEISDAKLKKLGVRLRLLSVWESKPIDTKCAITVEFVTSGNTVPPEINVELFDSKGQGLATDTKQRVARDNERIINLFNLSTKDRKPFPSGTQVRISIKTDSKTL